ncbi:MAG: GGDEF domain-containing protein [Spirochaetes bacterium]|nr:GGDEF domain-containing protein [Spirochaetota bacterium]
MNPVVDFISGIPLFGGMSGLELNAVSAFLEPRRCKAGETIFREGDPGGELLVVKTGRVASSAAGSDGSVRDLGGYGPGQFFGEIAMVEGVPHPATCRADGDCELYVLEGIDFFRLVWEHPMIGVKLLSNMARAMVAALDRSSVFLDDLVRWGETARRRAITDGLSGLFNRRFLDEAVAIRLARGDSASRPCSVFMLDIDRFREVNTAFGESAGDAVISTVGASIVAALREGDIAARFSGVEFGFLLPIGGIFEASAVAERVRQVVAELFLEFRAGRGSKPSRVTVTASIGVAAWPVHGTTAAELFASADRALYRAKADGRNRVSAAE